MSNALNDLRAALATRERGSALFTRATRTIRTLRDILRDVCAERDAARAELYETADQRDVALADRDLAITERNAARADRDAARADRDGAHAARDEAIKQRDAARAERDEAIKQRNEARADFTHLYGGCIGADAAAVRHEINSLKRANAGLLKDLEHSARANREHKDLLWSCAKALGLAGYAWDNIARRLEADKAAGYRWVRVHDLAERAEYGDRCREAIDKMITDLRKIG